MEKEIKDILVKQAKEKGMCLPNYKPMCEADNLAELIALYKRTVDWALENQFPSYDALEKYFYDCDHYGVFVGVTFKGKTLNNNAIYVFHNCKGEINVEMNLQAQIIPMLYFANGCDLNVVCNQQNPVPIRVPLYLFGENNVNATDDNNAVYARYQMELM